MIRRTTFKLAIACLVCVLWTVPAAADFFKVIRSYPEEAIGTAPTLSWPNANKPLVVVRYPAAFSPDVVDAARAKYLEGPYYAFERAGALGKPDDASFDRMLTNSMYYAAEFTEQLKTRIPDARVVILGGTIGFDEKKAFAWVDDSAKPVADVLIDFTAYIWPQGGATAMGSFQPIVSIRVAPVVAPEVHGSVFIQTPFRGLGSHVEGSNDPFQALGPNLVELLNYTGKKETGKLPPLLAKDRYMEKRPYNGTKIVSLRGLAAILHEDESQKGTYPLPDSFKIWSFLTIDALNLVGAHPSAKLRPDYAASFDPAAAGGLDEGKLATLVRFRSAEADFLNLQSEKLNEAILKGSFGDSFRVTRQKEIATASKANTVGWLGVLASAATMGVSGSAALIGMAIDKTHANMANNFNESIAAVLKTQLNVAVQMGNEEMTITATNLSALRSQLVTLYRKAYGLPLPAPAALTESPAGATSAPKTPIAPASSSNH